MSWFTSLFSSSSVITDIGNIIDNLHTSNDEKEAAKFKFKQLLQQRDSELEQTIRKQLESKERILVAELTQGDSYTKRARPTVVYFGLFMIAVNYLVIPLMMYVSGDAPAPFDLPTEFWAAWGGIVGTWAIGRSFEKSGKTNKLTQTITGKSPGLLE